MGVEESMIESPERLCPDEIDVINPSKELK